MDPHKAGASIDDVRSRLGFALAAIDPPPSHFLRRERLRDDGVRAFEHFLALRPLQLPGYEDMLRRFIERAVYSSSSNEGYLPWTDTLSELSAIFVLAQMGLELRGIEQRSPLPHDR